MFHCRRILGVGAALLFLSGCGWIEYLERLEEPEEGGEAAPVPFSCDPSMHRESPERKRACLAREGRRWALAPDGYECLPPRPEMPPSEAECLRRGGDPAPYGTPEGAPYRFCSLPTSDGGKPCCSDESCEGACIAMPGSALGEPAEGRCSRVTRPSCWSHFEDGLYQGDVCT